MNEDTTGTHSTHTQTSNTEEMQNSSTENGEKHLPVQGTGTLDISLMQRTADVYMVLCLTKTIIGNMETPLLDDHMRNAENPTSHRARQCYQNMRVCAPSAEDRERGREAKDDHDV